MDIPDDFSSGPFPETSGAADGRGAQDDQGREALSGRLEHLEVQNPYKSWP